MLKKKSDFSDSEEEYVQSRVGEVPEQWYDRLSHFGYNEKGQKVAS